jgi:Immunity protein Imm1
MTLERQQPKIPILTASLTTGVVQVAHGLSASLALIDEILKIEHTEWETTLSVGDTEFHQTTEGPYPDHQMRVSAQPSVGYAALNYTDHVSMANSYNPDRPLPTVFLVFKGGIGSLFSPTAAILIEGARKALHEWLRTRQRPTCIEWQPYDAD